MSPYSFSKPKIRLLKGLGCNMLIQTEYQSPLPSSTEGHDPSMNEKSRQRKTLAGMMEFQSPACGTREEHSRNLLKRAVSKAAGELKPQEVQPAIRGGRLPLQWILANG